MTGRSHYTPKLLTEKVLASRASLEGERKCVTVLFVDIRGSVALSQQVDPEEWHFLMEGFFEIVTQCVHAFEGTINQYTGDGAMALFGAPVAHEDHELRACYAALRIRDGLNKYAAQLKEKHGMDLGFRLGMNSGEVVVGKIGNDLRMDYTANGLVPGVASRMEELAEPGSIYLTEATARPVEGLCELRSLGAHRIKGIDSPLEIFELMSARPERTRIELARQRGFSRFVNRKHEFDFMKSALEQAHQGQGQAVAFVGNPGIGKSRLCLEFEEYCREQGCIVHKTHGVANGRWLSFFPAMKLLRSFFGISGDDGVEAAREKIRHMLSRLGPDMESSLPRVYEFLGVPDRKIELPQINPDLQRHRNLEFIRWTFRNLERSKTMVLFLEDLQCFDESSLEIVDALVSAVPHTNVMIVANYRPEFQPPWVQEETHCHRLALLPLDQPTSEQLVAGVLGDDPSVTELVSRLAGAAAGNPFFMEEMIQGLVDNVALQGNRGDYRLEQQLETMQIPSTVQNVIASRIDHRSDQEKEILQAAAVIGREFSGSLLGSMLDVSEAELVVSLDRLCSDEFITEIQIFPHTEYNFRHALIQEVAYRSLLRDKRARLHARAAEAIESLYGKEVDRYAALLAQHWEAAGNNAQAAMAYYRAGEWAAQTNIRESMYHRRKVIELQDISQPLSPEARRIAVSVRQSLLHWAPATAYLSPREADALFQQGCGLAEGSPLEQAQLFGAYAIYLAVCHDYELGIEYADRGAELLESAGLPALRVYADAVVKSVCYSSAGRPRIMYEVTNSALRYMESSGVPHVMPGLKPDVWATTFHAMSVGILGDPQRSLNLLVEASQMAREESDLMLVNAAGLQARIRYFLGEAGDALPLTQEALELSSQVQAEHWMAQAHYYRGMAYVLHEQWPEALQHFEESRSHSKHGEVVFAVYGVSTAWLAHMRIRTGEPEDALALVEEALAFAQERKSLWVLQEALLVKCVVLRETRGKAAGAAIRETLEQWDRSIDDNGAEIYRHLVWLERARLAELTGDSKAEIKALQEALRIAQDLGAQGYIKNIEEALRDKT